MSAARRRTASKIGSTSADEVDRGSKMVNRRAVLRRAGLAAAGGGAAAALAGLGAKHASAANGNPVILGTNNLATGGTGVITSSSTALTGETTDVDSAGLLGIDNSGSSGGYGVSGYSVYGLGVGAASVNSSPLYLTLGNSAGPLTTGTHYAGEIYIDSSAAMWLCTLEGSPGTWRPILVGGLTNNVGAAQTILNASVSGVAALNVVNATSASEASRAGLARPQTLMG